MRFHGKGVMLVLFAVFCGVMIVISCSRPDTARRHKDPYVPVAKAFLGSPEGGGKQNALSNYVRAMEKFDERTYTRHEKTFQEILRHGWTGTEQTALNALDSLQPILKEIRRGNERDFVRYPVSTSWSSPVPDFLKLQLLGKLMIIQGLYCEYTNQPHEALEWYKHAVIFGQRMCDENSQVIAKLTSIAIEGITLKSFQPFLIRQNLTSDMYLKIADDLIRLRSSETPFWRLMQNDHRMNYNMLKDMKAEIDELEKLPPQEQRAIKFIVENKETVLRQYKDFTEKQESLLQKELPVIIRTDFDILTAELSPFLKTFVAHFTEAPVREGNTYARWALTIATAQVRAYRTQKGTLPSSLSTLSEIGVTPPEDPFSNDMVKYDLRGNSAALYSIGPDLMDNGGQLEYDPTNGTISSGDIIVNVQ